MLILTGDQSADCSPPPVTKATFPSYYVDVNRRVATCAGALDQLASILSLKRSWRWKRRKGPPGLQLSSPDWYVGAKTSVIKSKVSAENQWNLIKTMFVVLKGFRGICVILSSVIWWRSENTISCDLGDLPQITGCTWKGPIGAQPWCLWRGVRGGKICQPTQRRSTYFLWIAEFILFVCAEPFNLGFVPDWEHVSPGIRTSTPVSCNSSPNFLSLFFFQNVKVKHSISKHLL